MQPTNVKHNAAFIVDISKLGCVKDLYCDDMGWIDVDFSGFVTTHGKSKPYVYHLSKKYFAHKTFDSLIAGMVRLWLHIFFLFKYFWFQ